MGLAVVDACFLINWSYFRQRDDLFTLFERLIVPTPVYAEVKSEEVRSFVARLLAGRRLLLAPRLPSIDQLALRLFEVINAEPGLPSIDPPEAYALALAREMGVPLLTDNAAPKLASRFIGELSGVEVLDSLDVLVRLYRGPELKRKIEEFSNDTGVVFSERRLREHAIR